MRSISLEGLDVHAAQTHAAILNTETGERRGLKLHLSPVEVVDFLGRCQARSVRFMKRGRPGSGSRVMRASRGSMCGSLPLGRSRVHLETGSRPIGVTPSVWYALAAGELRFAFAPTVAGRHRVAGQPPAEDLRRVRVHRTGRERVLPESLLQPGEREPERDHDQ
jgi:hypothetical protein